jgi:3-oxoacyl-[acyl-carrier-protein] synthase-3
VSEGQPSASIAGTGSFLPPHRVDNRTLFEHPGIRENFDVERARGSLKDAGDASGLSPAEVFDLWARQVTGIEERRAITEGDGLTTELMCAEAGRRALDAAGMEADELDLILAASLTGSRQVPNVACTVAAELGVPRVGGYVLNAACSGFVYALGSAYAHVRAGTARNVLVVVGDTLTKITNYSDPKTAVLFGDGAGAAVLTPCPEGEGVLGRPYFEADYAYEHLNLLGQGWETPEEPEPKLHMGGGPQVLRQAIQAMKRVAQRALESTELGWADIDYVIPHQANLRITQGLERQLPLTSGKVIHTIRSYGNMSASTVAVTLDEVLRGLHGPLPDPTRLVLTAVGGGYTSAGLVVDWRPSGRGRGARQGAGDAVTERILGR